MNGSQVLVLVRERLAARQPVQLDVPHLTRAAVLVPLILRGDEPFLLFTERSTHVPTHQGQVSFPGGVHEADDADLMQTAVREAWEEIGVPPEHVTILGRMDDVATNTTGYAITPFVAVIPPDVARITSDLEVARIIEASLDQLLDPANRRPDPRTGRWQYMLPEVVVWGATARILSGFLGILGLANPLEAQPGNPR
jgi:8-oxo-dGTP pyrophosphatase MutT (NUDIX family)